MHVNTKSYKIIVKNVDFEERKSGSSKSSVIGSLFMSVQAQTCFS